MFRGKKGKKGVSPAADGILPRALSLTAGGRTRRRSDQGGGKKREKKESFSVCVSLAKGGILLAAKEGKGGEEEAKRSADAGAGRNWLLSPGRKGERGRRPEKERHGRRLLASTVRRMPEEEKKAPRIGLKGKKKERG